MLGISGGFGAPGVAVRELAREDVGEDLCVAMGMGVGATIPKEV